MKKFTFIVIFSLFIFLLSTNVVGKASAVALDVPQDECGQEFTYSFDEDLPQGEVEGPHLHAHYSNGKVTVDFYDADDGVPSITDSEVIITAAAGYELTSLKYQTGDEVWTTLGTVNNPTTEVHLAGAGRSTNLDVVEVKVKKVCATPTCTPTPTEGSEEPTVTPTPTEEVTPTGTQNVGGPGDGLSDGRSDGRSTGPSTGSGSTMVSDPYTGVLGASTMAKTGSFEQNLMNLFGVVGMALLALGYKSYRKELNA